MQSKQLHSHHRCKIRHYTLLLPIEISMSIWLLIQEFEKLLWEHFSSTRPLNTITIDPSLLCFLCKSPTSKTKYSVSYASRTCISNPHRQKFSLSWCILQCISFGPRFKNSPWPGAWKASSITKLHLTPYAQTFIMSLSCRWRDWWSTEDWKRSDWSYWDGACGKFFQARGWAIDEAKQWVTGKYSLFTWKLNSIY